MGGAGEVVGACVFSQEGDRRQNARRKSEVDGWSGAIMRAAKQSGGAFTGWQAAMPRMAVEIIDARADTRSQTSTPRRHATVPLDRGQPKRQGNKGGRRRLEEQEGFGYSVGSGSYARDLQRG